MILAAFPWTPASIVVAEGIQTWMQYSWWWLVSVKQKVTIPSLDCSISCSWLVAQSFWSACYLKSYPWYPTPSKACYCKLKYLMWKPSFTIFLGLCWTDVDKLRPWLCKILKTQGLLFALLNNFWEACCCAGVSDMKLLLRRTCESDSLEGEALPHGTFLYFIWIRISL